MKRKRELIVNIKDLDKVLPLIDKYGINRLIKILKKKNKKIKRDDNMNKKEIELFMKIGKLNKIYGFEIGFKFNCIYFDIAFTIKSLKYIKRHFCINLINLEIHSIKETNRFIKKEYILERK